MGSVPPVRIAGVAAARLLIVWLLAAGWAVEPATAVWIRVLPA